jgi:hypothetical protein
VAVFWRPEMLPTIVLLQPAPDSTFGAQPLDLAQLGGARTERLGPDGRYVIVRHDLGELRLWLRDASPDQPLAIVMPLNDDLPTRAMAALRLWAQIAGRAAGHGREPLALTRQRRERLVLMLRALDGHLANASYREIAEVLFGARRLEREAWKTSSLRDRTIRLVKGGLALMRAGYRKLLRRS